MIHRQAVPRSLAEFGSLAAIKLHLVEKVGIIEK
jgi:hypothetical protein